MKNLILLSASFLMIVLCSCSKDDDNEKITDSQLYGEWTFERVQAIDSSWVLTDTGTVEGNVTLNIKPDAIIKIISHRRLHHESAI